MILIKEKFSIQSYLNYQELELFNLGMTDTPAFTQVSAN